MVEYEATSWLIMELSPFWKLGMITFVSKVNLSIQDNFQLLYVLMDAYVNLPKHMFVLHVCSSKSLPVHELPILFG